MFNIKTYRIYEMYALMEMCLLNDRNFNISESEDGCLFLGVIFVNGQTVHVSMEKIQTNHQIIA